MGSDTPHSCFVPHELEYLFTYLSNSLFQYLVLDMRVDRGLQCEMRVYLVGANISGARKIPIVGPFNHVNTHRKPLLQVNFIHP